MALAQNQIKLDSLQLQLQNTDVDTLKIQTLIEISNHYATHNYILSAEYAQKARDLAVEKGLNNFEAKSNRVLGRICFNIGDYKNATTYYFQALKFYEAQKDTSGIMAMNVNRFFPSGEKTPLHALGIPSCVGKPPVTGTVNN